VDGAVVQAIVCKDAASVQIRHLGAYQGRAAKNLRRELPALSGQAKKTIPYLQINSTSWKDAHRALAHFQKLAGRPIEGDPRFDPTPA
jgi:hypothetical protein